MNLGKNLSKKRQKKRGKSRNKPAKKKLILLRFPFGCRYTIHKLINIHPYCQRGRKVGGGVHPFLLILNSTNNGTNHSLFTFLTILVVPLND